MNRKQFTAIVVSAVAARKQAPGQTRISEDADELRIETPAIDAAIRKRGYVSGVYRQTFLDKKTGFRDPGMGLDIVDWIMEPGSDEAYRGMLAPGMGYLFNTPEHGRRAKRTIEGPQICTKARELSPRAIRGSGFVAVKQDYRYHMAAPGRKTGSLWEQTIVFPEGKRYFVSSDRISAVNSTDEMFVRIDLPCHAQHNRGDTFSEIYLSYHGRIPSMEFADNFPPDEKFNYRRDRDRTPQRFIRAYRLRDPKSGREGPWLAGMILDPSVVYEAWCHQRRYVCMILEFGGRPIKAGESFSAAFIVGYFDSIEEMHQVYDRHRGHTGLEADAQGWRLTK